MTASVRKGYPFGVEVVIKFDLLVDLVHKDVLEALRSFFGVGKIYITGTNATFRVTGINSLQILAAHFLEYPLLSRKKVTFEL